MSQDANFQSGALFWSVNRLAREFGMARDTVQRRISQSGLAADGLKGGHPVYLLRRVAPVLVNKVDPMGDGFDPMILPPMERRAWFQSENERLSVEERKGVLIPAMECEGEFAWLAKTVVRELETLLDTMERDLRPNPEILEYIEQKIHALRQAIADRVAGEEWRAEETGHGDT